MGLKKHIVYVGMIALSAMSVGCKKDQCLKGDGYVQKQEIEVDPFTAVSANLSATVELVHDTSSKTPFVEVISEANVAEHVGVAVRDSELQIQLGFCFTQHQDIKVIVHYDTLNTITLDGPTTINSQVLMTENELTLINKGSGTINANVQSNVINSVIDANGAIYLNGHIKEHFSEVNGSGKLHAYNCFTEQHTTTTNGSGYTYTRTALKLNATINGSGNIYFKGFPIIDEQINGSGQVISDN